MRIRLDMRRNLAFLQPSFPSLVFSSKGQRVKGKLRWRSARDFSHFNQLLVTSLAHAKRLPIFKQDRAIRRSLAIIFVYFVEINNREPVKGTRTARGRSSNAACPGRYPRTSKATYYNPAPIWDSFRIGGYSPGTQKSASLTFDSRIGDVASTDSKPKNQ